MKQINYWIAPHSVYQFEFPNDFMYKGSNITDVKASGRITIAKELGCLDKPPKGLSLSTWNLCGSISNYSIRTEFKSNYDLSPGSLLTVGRDTDVTIYTPYIDYYILGNDLSYISLMNKVMTIRCSSFILKETLFLFLGESGSGKSTIVAEAKENFINPIILSDDHLGLNVENNSISAFTPLWDKVNLDMKEAKCKEIKKMIVFLLEDESSRKKIQRVSSVIEKITFVLKSTVLFGVDKGISKKLLDYSKGILHYDFYIAPQKNCIKIFDFIRSIE
ncbi:hypothetical protein HYG86_12635 [Alkalicella caledoniensis]|uniref:Uncharacterized protein n=1 Tax=Alkalicella caledoniensis TaxID=2731377 RepID=A0A7G9WA44_ALKCA|nr:hypothetical protein [Alkalicella caledoniensis]QNO15556.1 hypothetical protein HYG86_12635 [Alkalicella caledoniensis]